MASSVCGCVPVSLYLGRQVARFYLFTMTYILLPLDYIKIKCRYYFSYIEKRDKNKYDINFNEILDIDNVDINVTLWLPR